MPNISAKRAATRLPQSLADVETVFVDTDILVIGAGNAG